MTLSRQIIGIGLLMLLLAVGAACGDDDEDVAPTATDVDAATATEPVDEPSATPPPFQGGRDPVELPGDGQGGALLTDVRAASHDGFDRAVFEFDNALPGANVAFLRSPAVACGSGFAVDVEGDVFLQVRMFPSAAHDDAGQPTFGPQEIEAGLPAIVEVVLTCDFEGEVTWVVGISGAADFAAVSLTDPNRVVVDVGHP